MAVSYAYAKQFHRKPVICDCHDGFRHYGIVQNVTPTHLYLQPIRPSVRLVSDSSDQPLPITLENNVTPVIEPTYYPFGPAGLVLPLYALLALSLFWW